MNGFVTKRGLADTALLAGGVALVSCSGYLFVAVAINTLSPFEAAAVSSFYLIGNIIGPGLYFGMEQEVARTTSATVAAGGSWRAAMSQWLRRCSVVVVLVITTLIAGSWLLTNYTFLGHWELFLATAVMALVAPVLSFSRGVLSGLKAYGGYSTTLAVEGGARLVLTVLVLVTGIGVVATYSGLFVMGSALAAITGWFCIGLPKRRNSDGGVWGRVDGRVYGQSASLKNDTSVRTMLLVMMATVGGHGLANIGPVIVTGRLNTQVVVATAFASMFILARIPLLALAPIQALMMPAVSGAVARGDYSVVRKVVVGILVASGTLGSLGVIVGTSVGRPLVELVFNIEVPLSGGVFGVLCGSTALLLAAQLMQVVLVALGTQLAAVVWWGVGATCLGVTIFLPVPVIGAAMWAQVVGPAVALIGMSIVAFRKTHKTATLDRSTAESSVVAPI